MSRWATGRGLVLVLLLAAGPSPGQVPGSILEPGGDSPEVPFSFMAQQPKQDKKDPKPPPIDLTQADPPRTAPTGLNPHMIGDFPGNFGFVIITVPTTATFTVQQFDPPTERFVDVTVTVPTTTQVLVRIPSALRGSFKIGENESPFPQCRVFLTYNYFHHLQGPNDGSDIPRTVQQTLLVNGVPTPVTVAVPGVPAPILNVHRETFGFEKAFWDHRASFGMRVPILQMLGPGSVGDQAVGDISLMFKYVPWRNEETGNGFSTGLIATLPTGPGTPFLTEFIHPTLLQPFVGYLWNFDRFFLQGFSSIVVPTDRRDVTMLFNDIGLSYRLYVNEDQRLVTSLTPTIEAHVTTPLNHRSSFDVIGGLDIVVLTAGLHIGLGERSLLTLGLGTPVTGPKVFDVEATVQFNLRF